MTSMKDVQLKSLFHDQTRYTKAFKTYARHQRKFEILADWVDTVFPVEIVDKLASNLSHHRVEPLSLMGVGAGTGIMDCRMIHKLMERFPRILNTVVEPAGDHIDEYKELARSQGFDIGGWEWRSQTWGEFMEEGVGPRDSKFHFISSVHSLYYFDDWKKGLLNMIGCLEDGGVLMVIVAAGDSGAARFMEKFPMLTDEKWHNVTSHSVTDVLSENGVEFDILHQASSVDIGCCFEEGNPEGDLIADFVTQASNFSKTAPRQLVEEVFSYLKGTDCSFHRGGKLFFKNDWEAVVVTREYK